MASGVPGSFETLLGVRSNHGLGQGPPTVLGLLYSTGGSPL